MDFEEGKNVIAYLSRSFITAEAEMTITELECLSIIGNVEKRRHYPEGVHFKVISDNHFYYGFKT